MNNKLLKDWKLIEQNDGSYDLGFKNLYYNNDSFSNLVTCEEVIDKESLINGILFKLSTVYNELKPYLYNEWGNKTFDLIKDNENLIMLEGYIKLCLEDVERIHEITNLSIEKLGNNNYEIYLEVQSKYGEIPLQYIIKDVIKTRLNLSLEIIDKDDKFYEISCKVVNEDNVPQTNNLVKIIHKNEILTQKFTDKNGTIQIKIPKPPNNIQIYAETNETPDYQLSRSNLITI